MFDQPRSKYEVHPSGMVVDATTGEVVTDAGEVATTPQFAHLWDLLDREFPDHDRHQLIGVLAFAMLKLDHAHRPFDLLKYTEQVVHDSAGPFEPADPSGDPSPAEVDALDVEALLTLLDLQHTDPLLRATSGQELALALLAHRSERQPHGHVGPCTAAVLSHLFQVDRATNLTTPTITQLIADLPFLVMTR